jgi:hypothetical protein
VSPSAAVVAILTPQIGKALEFCEADLPSNAEVFFQDRLSVLRTRLPSKIISQLTFAASANVRSGRPVKKFVDPFEFQ